MSHRLRGFWDELDVSPVDEEDDCRISDAEDMAWRTG